MNYTCPKCSKPMVKRHRIKDGVPFYGCQGYPHCKGTRNIYGGTEYLSVEEPSSDQSALALQPPVQPEKNQTSSQKNIATSNAPTGVIELLTHNNTAPRVVLIFLIFLGSLWLISSMLQGPNPVERPSDPLKSHRVNLDPEADKFYKEAKPQKPEEQTPPSNLSTTCKECGGQMVLRHGKYGPFMGCLNFPKCRYTFDPSKPQPPLVDLKCPKCQSPMVKRTGKFGEFYGCSRFPQCRGTRSIRD